MLNFRSDYAVTATKDYVYFAAGLAPLETNIVDVLNASFNNWTFKISKPRAGLGATSLNNKVYFGGGYNFSNAYFTTVDICDADTGIPSATSGSTTSGTSGSTTGGSGTNIVPIVVGVVVGFVALVILIAVLVYFLKFKQRAVL